MPDARLLLDDGIRAERAGALEQAYTAYEAAATASSDPGLTSEAFRRLADIHRERCKWAEGVAAARRAQDIARTAGLPDALVHARIAEGNVLMIQGEFAEAMTIFRDVAESASDAHVRGIALQNVGSMLAQLGQHGAAERAFAESLGNFQKADYVRGQVIALNNLGRLAIDRGAHQEARPLLERAHAEANDIEDSELAALASQNLATALAHLGADEYAMNLAVSALGYFTACENHFRTIECLRLLALIHERAGDITSARSCYERALNLAVSIESEVEARVTRHQLKRLGQPGPRS